MSDWSSRKQHHSHHSPSSTYFHRNHQSNSSFVSPFGNTNPSSHDPRSAPFSSFPSSAEDIDEVDECCSYIGKLLINEAPSHHRNLHHQQSRHPAHSEHQSKHGSSPGKPGTMTIGHHHHYSNRHHYPYHDHYHDDSPLLPRIEFPSSQFDRLLRGSPNLDRSSDTSSNRFTSSTRDSSSSTSLSSSSSSSSSSPFSSSNSSSRHSSWKSGPFENRKK